MKSKFKLGIAVIVLCLVGLAGCVVAMVVMLNGGVRGNSYQRCMELAEEYVEQGDTEQAILCYWDAIDADSSREEAYSLLADLYEQEGDRKMVLAVLRMGVRNTSSDLLVERLTLWESGGGDKSEVPAETETIKTTEETVVVNTTLLTILGSSTYGDYAVSYGTPTVTAADGGCQVVYDDLDMTFYYSEVNASTRQPDSTAVPSYITMEWVGMLFSGFDGSLSYTTLSGYSVAGLDIGRDADHGYVVTFEKNGCRVTIETDESGNITSGSAWNQIVPLTDMVIDDGNDSHILTGRVLDAVSGNGVSGAMVVLSAGGTSLETVTASSAGSYSFSGLEAGDYVLSVSCNGYITENFGVEVENWANTTTRDLVISPELTEGEVRIVLEWGAAPTDLDSYLYGTMDSGTAFTTCYYDKNAYSGGELVASLDVDDTDGYGPETTTIYDMNGVFSFVVRDFTETGTMNVSGATVKIYMPGQSAPTVVEVSGSVVNAWNVCTIDHGVLTVNNVPY